MFIRVRDRRVLGRALAAAAALGTLAGPAWSQKAPVLQNLADVKALPGTLVAEARLRAPETALQITGYRVEHVALPEPYRVGIQGKEVEVGEGWHVTVTFGAPLTVRAQAFSLVIDGRWCGFLQEAPDLRSADTVCFDAALIRDGAAIGATYRSIQIASSPRAEKALAADASFTDSTEAVHYASARLQLRGRQ
jgi:hypothetical protein